MAWSRIEDTVPHHRKFATIGSEASWMYVCGLVHCNSQRSDGFIAARSVQSLGIFRRASESARRLVKAGLWEPVPGGYQIHDFLDYNPTRAEALHQEAVIREQRRQAGLASGRSRRASIERNANGAVEHPLNPIPSHPIPSQISQVKNKPIREVLAAEKSNGNGNGNGHHSAVTARSKRPIFAGQRFVIFEWMLADMGQILGPHLDAFDVHTWLDALDQQAVKDALVKPKNAWWPWVQAELLLEATRRGLPMAEVGLAVSDQTKKNLAAMKGAIARIQGGSA